MAPTLTVVSKRPSPLFVVLVAAAIAAGAYAWTEDFATKTYAVFAFVLLGWVVSLCLHEFAHARMAFAAGDTSVAEKGYLTLDPRRYVHPVLSILMPIVFLLMGGIGLPGGAVWIQMGAIRTKAERSLVSAAGPLTNLMLGVVLALPFRLFPSIIERRPVFASALAFLALLQFIAALLNAVPLPGLDGFGVLEPYLPRSFLETIAPYRQYSIVVLFVLAWRTPWFGHLVFGNSRALLELVGGDSVLSGVSQIGALLFRFWE
jgi:Zn-dependent protease